MFSALISRFKQGHRTMPYPKAPIPMVERFRGYPELESIDDAINQLSDEQLCPYNAISKENNGAFDLGKCIFCAECTVPGIRFSNDFQLAVSQRNHLKIINGQPRYHATPLIADLRKLFGRSLKFREVSAGGCNACEADTNVLSTIGWDLGRFGIQFVASPRHADGLWVTGPVTENMREALLTTYEAIPSPKIVVACGACAINGGPYIDAEQTHNGIDELFPVDLYIPGCPPNPATILDGLLRLLGTIS